MTEDQPPDFRLLPDSDEEPATSTAEQPPGPRRLGPRQRLVALVVAGLLVIGGISLQVHRSHDAARRPAQASSTATSAAAPTLVPQPVAEPWPSTGAPCNPSVLLPILSTSPLDQPIPARLVVGGDSLYEVNLAAGTFRSLLGGTIADPTGGLPSGSFVVDRQTVAGPAGPVSYLETRDCRQSDPRLFRFSSGGRAVPLAGNGLATSGLFPDGTGGIWTTRIGPSQDLSDGIIAFTLVRLDRPEVINLPVNLTPVALHGTLLVAKSNDNRTAETTVSLVVLDLKSLRVVRKLGPVASITQSQGQVVWTAHGCSAVGLCELDSYDLATGAIVKSSYALPVEAQITGGVLSPDRQRLAFELSRMSDDPRYLATAAGTPGDLVVLNLATGIIEPVPNLELPPSTSQIPVGLTFTPDSKWLVISATIGETTRLLAWHAGLDHPLVSAAALPSAPNSLPALVQLLPAG